MPFTELDLSKEKPNLRTALVLGVEKSGKTTFAGTAEKPILFFCFDGTGYKRLAGQEGIQVVLVEGSNVVSEFEREVNSLIITPKKYKWPDGREEPFKTIVFDPYSFHSDNVYDEEDGKPIDSFKVYGNVMRNHKNFFGQVKRLAKLYDVIVTSHVEIRQDDTTGKKMMLADLNGKTRNSIGGHFDAVLFTNVVKRGVRVEYKVSLMPDEMRKAGVRVPMGCEDLFGDLEEPNFTKLKDKFNAGLTRLKEKVQPQPKQVVTPTTGGVSK